MKKKFLILILILNIFASKDGVAKFEKGVNDQNILRQSLFVKDKTTIYGQAGLGLVSSNGDSNSEISLTRNDAGDLNWNNNKLIDSNGTVNTQNIGISGSAGGPVLFQSTDDTTTKVLAQQEINPFTRKTQSRLLVLEKGGNSIKWAFPKTLSTNPSGENNTCEKACAAIAGANVAKTICTEAHEGIFSVGCSTLSGALSGVNNTCTCLSFQTFNAN